jgi:hypothetical protein
MEPHSPKFLNEFMKQKNIGTIFLLVICLLPSFAQKKSFPEVSALPEQKVMPDPLVMFDGTPVKTKEQWIKQRRPELKELFQNYMYGYLPKAPKIKATVTKTEKDFFGGKATMKEVTIELGRKDAPKIYVVMFLPNQKKSPAATILGTNFCGNHALTTDPRVTLNPHWIPTSQYCPGVVNNKATDAARGKGIDSEWGIENAIDRGYAVVSFFNGDVVPDKPDMTAGVFPFFSTPNADKDSSWGAEAAWAWGFHRVVDFLVKEKSIDKNRIAVFGHSRYGKAAMFAGAHRHSLPASSRNGRHFAKSRHNRRTAESH